MAMIEFQLHDIGDLLSWIDAQGEAGQKAVSYTIKDIKSRVPAWVATEVTSVYNIKRRDVVPAKTEENRKKQAVYVSISGNTLETVKIVYRGRTLTPIHFSMSPKMPPKGKGSRTRILKSGQKMFKRYVISMEVIKGSRYKIKGKPDLQKPFIAPNMGKNRRKTGEDPVYIAFQRKGASRTDMYSIRTLSIPQMLGNSHVYDKINKRVTEATKQRVQHHLDRFAPKD